MPLNRPILDDRSYQQLRDELVQRIPVYAPEWTDHNASDPGITLIELFAFLGENLLYRFNQIPDATYLEYLRLLQLPLRPAVAARAMLEFSTEQADGVPVPMASVVKAGDLPFQTQDEVRVLPLAALALCKASDALPSQGGDPDAAERFEQAYQAAGLTTPTDTAAYRSKQLGPDGDLPLDLDESVDAMLWVAVLAADPETAQGLRETLVTEGEVPPQLNLGFVPDIHIDPDQTVPGTAFTELTRCPGQGAGAKRHAVQWEVGTGALNGEEPVYRALETAGDTTDGLSREGIVRLRLPADLAEFSPFPLDDPDLAGTGERPPLLDEEIDERVVFWLRCYRLDGTDFGQVMHLGANCVTAVQSKKAGPELLGTGTGQPKQAHALVNRQVLSGSLYLQVEEHGRWADWHEVGSLHASGDADRHYVLDAEAGRIHFGDGLRGRAPQIGERIRALEYRHGGGGAGNVPAEAIAKISSVRGVKVSNPLAAYGGADAEPLEQALERIPGELRRRDRAVTRGDFAELAKATPGADIARAECLPLRIPQRPNVDSAGAVSVIIWPGQDPVHPNAPLPDRNQIAQVCAWLDARRLVTTELYVRPPRYRSIAVAVGLKVGDRHGIDAVRHWVELILRQFLAPLPPYGPEGQGWPLGRRVLAAELEAAALQVEGAEYLEGMKLKDLSKANSVSVREITLDEDQVPELAAISVESGPVSIEPGEGLAPPDAGERKPPVPVPVIREEC